MCTHKERGGEERKEKRLTATPSSVLVTNKNKKYPTNSKARVEVL